MRRTATIAVLVNDALDLVKRLKSDKRVPGEVTTLVDEVKNILNSPGVKKTFKVGGNVISAFQPFIEKPTWFHAAQSTFSLGKLFIDDVEVWSDNYFEDDSWVEPYNRDFTPLILNLVMRYPFTLLKTARETEFIRLVDMDGIRLGWVFNAKVNIVSSIYVQADQLEDARETIRRLLWAQYQGQSLVMRRNRRAFGGPDTRVTFETDDAFHPLPSAKATEYATYLKRCLDAGVSRSVMLHGPPGTGKSTLARTLVNNLGLRSFRIRVEDVSDLENSVLAEAINIFQPDAIILDDFDRAHSQAQLLETLETFRRSVKLVIATVNDKDRLDEALLRPGRFDEMVFVDRMDDAVIHKMLDQFDDGFDDVKDWPISFIEEYCQRRRFMDSTEASASMIELGNRVKRLDKYKLPQDDWEQLAAKKTPA